MAVHPRKSTPTGDLPDAIREWADWNYKCAKFSASQLQPMHPSLVNPGDPSDWRSHMSIRERRLIEAAMALGIWEPDA